MSVTITPSSVSDKAVAHNAFAHGQLRVDEPGSVRRNTP
jgi:hypothetical protein